MVGITYTTRNRPEVLAYSLSKLDETLTRETVIVIDDASDCAEQNKAIVNRYGFTYLLNKKRQGIPRSKERGFRCLQHYDYQVWADDDAYFLPGWQEKLIEAMEIQGHLLHLREWCFIKKKKDYGLVVSYTGASACLMTFRKDMYKDVHGFSNGFTKYGHWHSRLSQKMAKYGVDEYVAIKDSEKVFRSFDIDGIPEDFKGKFVSSMSDEERKKELESWKRKK